MFSMYYYYYFLDSFTGVLLPRYSSILLERGIKLVTTCI